MKDVVLTINGKKRLIPTSWDGISFYRYCAISNMTGDEVIAYFLGMSLDELMQYTHITNFEVVSSALSFLQELPTPNDKKTFTYYGKEYTIEQEVLDMCIGQYKDTITIANGLEESKEKANEQVKLLIATYLQPMIDKSGYDADRAEQLKEEIAEQLSVQDCINIQGFFLQKRMRLRDGIRTTSSQLNIPKKKTSLVYQILSSMGLG